MGKSVSGDGELTHTEDADSKLRDGNHAKSKLAYGDESLGWNRTAVRSILEADMQKRQSQDRGLGLVFETPSIPLLARRKGRTATRAEDCLLGDITSTFAARFRGTPRTMLLRIRVDSHRGSKRFANLRCFRAYLRRETA